ncbi:hypothetical protein F0562_004855 [Nyssa sinensis]|uniref:Transmembrane protein n=1 Tax=Nyssa sinensis TaxID=561372 RepID=A0A5J5AKG2_9ASTE|nr:hypothetical protein F0562_004855 [Nyssa sinensis]
MLSTLMRNLFTPTRSCRRSKTSSRTSMSKQVMKSWKLEVEQKYNEIHKPVYEKQNDIIKSTRSCRRSKTSSRTSMNKQVMKSWKLEVEQKYNEIHKPVYEKQNDIIKSTRSCRRSKTSSRTSMNKQVMKSWKLEVEQKYNEIPKPVYEKQNDIIKSIPDFRLTAFQSHLAGRKRVWIMRVPNGVAQEKKGSKRPHAEESFFTWSSETQQKDDMNEIHDVGCRESKGGFMVQHFLYFNNEADEKDFDGEVDDEGKAAMTWRRRVIMGKKLMMMMMAIKILSSGYLLIWAFTALVMACVKWSPKL